jgi:hypothetical protein
MQNRPNKFNFCAKMSTTATPIKHFVCQWSGLPVANRTFIPSGRANRGIFADLNCAVAWLQHKKPRNWRQKVSSLNALYQMHRGQGVVKEDIYAAPAEGWSLNDARRCVVPSLQQSHAEYEREERRLEARRKNRSTGEKRKREQQEPTPSAAAVPCQTSRANPVAAEAVAPPNNNLAAKNVAQAKAKRYKVTVTDDERKPRQRVIFTDNWRADVLKEYDLGHAVPVYFMENNQFVLHPLLGCDGKSVKATPCTIKVQALS